MAIVKRESSIKGNTGTNRKTFGCAPKKGNPLTCKTCKESKATDKYFPYCSAEHWKEAVNKP